MENLYDDDSRSNSQKQGKLTTERAFFRGCCNNEKNCEKDFLQMLLSEKNRKRNRRKGKNKILVVDYVVSIKLWAILPYYVVV